jgi:hypothetical protein
VRWASCAFDAAVRLEVEVAVIRGCDTAIDPCSRLAVLVAVLIFVFVGHGVEARVVAFDADECSDSERSTCNHFAGCFDISRMGDSNGFHFDVGDRTILTCGDWVRLVTVVDG